jgi:hypothetical protein
LISALTDKSFKELAASEAAKYFKSLVEVNMSFIPYESQVANAVFRDGCGDYTVVLGLVTYHLQRVYTSVGMVPIFQHVSLTLLIL